ncbi:flagellar biosynthetic protein FliR [Sphingomonas ginkgonis]|uniref:Flagellar biosynthetic protein FliR n=1 Tax=Sphingomonas ginkgonis TaxID=2315330 RepID=A0A429VEI3_9SPHN|nr:flagellar biosynthetic protein FliR [Sphingomonas ginkgonis]RST32262.1 flagellar biosynthetic protein FliR [Sphingomonas ginkgonis]
MMPASFAALEPQLLLWLVAMLRPGAAFFAAPLTGSPQVPMQLRLVISLAIGIPAVQLSGLHLPAEGLLSLPGLFLALGEIVIGLGMGFAVQLGFAAALVAGEAISNAMGIGFASMVNPMSGQSSSAIGHLLTLVATFLFLASDGHLLFARIVIESYAAFPPGGPVPLQLLGGLSNLGGLIFAAGLTIALPVTAALVLVQLIMGILGRSAPSLNLFSVGMPAAMVAGMILLAMTAPLMADATLAAVNQGLAEAARIAHGG